MLVASLQATAAVSPSGHCRIALMAWHLSIWTRATSYSGTALLNLPSRQNRHGGQGETQNTSSSVLISPPAQGALAGAGMGCSSQGGRHGRSDVSDLGSATGVKRGSSSQLHVTSQHVPEDSDHLVDGDAVVMG